MNIHPKAAQRQPSGVILGCCLKIVFLQKLEETFAYFKKNV